MAFDARNPLAYPAGHTPGFDPSHVAVGSAVFSCVALGGNQRSLITGRLGSPNLVTNEIDGGLGPCTKSVTGGDPRVTFTNSPIINDTVTMAAIVKYGAAVNGAILATSSAIASQWDLWSNANDLRLTNNGGTAIAGLAPVVDTPYFIAASAVASGAVKFLLCNLRTGVIQTASTTGVGATSASDGTAYIHRDAYGQTFQGSVAAAMYSNVYLDLPQLRKWASDPWSFWYPK